MGGEGCGGSNKCSALQAKAPSEAAGGFGGLLSSLSPWGKKAGGVAAASQQRWEEARARLVETARALQVRWEQHTQF